MRLIHSTTNVEEVKKLCHLFDTNKIDYTCEEEMNRDWGSEGFADRTFHLWVYDEDAVAQATSLLGKVNEVTLEQKKEPLPPIEPPLRPQATLRYQLEYSKRRIYSRISYAIILACITIFLLDSWSTKEAPTAKQTTASPVRKALLYDYPESFALLDKIISLYGTDALLRPNELPPPGKFLYDALSKEPLWLGIYPSIVLSAQHLFSLSPVDEPVSSERKQMFEKISQGEVWRLFSPAFLHTNILHLFFNMLWVMILATQIEAKVRPLRFIILVALLAAFSNTAQYLMSGANFLGFSGVICGMATFIHTRQNQAPWEGYYLSQGTYSFILVFIGILAFLSFISFLIEVLYSTVFPIGVANTAHISGALMGLLLGRIRFFSWQPRNE